MEAPRRSRARLAAGTLAVVVLGVLAAYPAGSSGDAGPLVALPGIVAVGALLASLALRVPTAIPWTLVPFLGEYATFLVLEDGDRFAPVVAAALVLVAELAYWALEPPSIAPTSRLVARRLLTLSVVVIASAGVAAFVVGASQLGVSGGIGLEALGVAAAVGAVAIIAVLARGAATR